MKKNKQLKPNTMYDFFQNGLLKALIVDTEKEYTQT